MFPLFHFYPILLLSILYHTTPSPLQIVLAHISYIRFLTSYVCLSFSSLCSATSIVSNSFIMFTIYETMIYNIWFFDSPPEKRSMLFCGCLCDQNMCLQFTFYFLQRTKLALLQFSMLSASRRDKLTHKINYNKYDSKILIVW